MDVSDEVADAFKNSLWAAIASRGLCSRSETLIRIADCQPVAGVVAKKDARLERVYGYRPSSYPICPDPAAAQPAERLVTASSLTGQYLLTLLQSASPFHAADWIR